MEAQWALQIFLKKMADLGLEENDPRLKKSMERLRLISVNNMSKRILKAQFAECIRDNIVFIRKALTGFIIKDFTAFAEQIDTIYHSCKTNRIGRPAPHYEKPRDELKDTFGVSLCTIDGQKHSIGSTKSLFSFASVHKPLTYALAMNECGIDAVHEYVGQEPSGEGSSVIKLSNDDKPHNPMMTTGAIVTASLLMHKRPLKESIAHVTQHYQKLAGGTEITINEDLFKRLKEKSYQDYALGYYLLEHNCFPEGTDFKEAMEFYFKLNCFEMTCETASVIAATLANGGICPLTSEEILDGCAVRHTLSLMHSCGMYDYSGQFAFKVSLPAKSSQAGVIMLVIPNVLGMCIWSPLTDQYRNSVRGIQFCEQMVEEMNAHHYTLRGSGFLNMTNDRGRGSMGDSTKGEINVANLLFASRRGDLDTMKRMYLSGVEMSALDYDGRTALHIACAEGHIDSVRFLLNVCDVTLDVKDRWGRRPYDDALKFKHIAIVNFLKQKYKAKKQTSLGVDKAE